MTLRSRAGSPLDSGNKRCPHWSPIVELRQYTLQPGQRDVLIELFDSKLVEPQEAVGMKVIGQFREPRRPDAFVWLRGFPDMQQRARSLAAFYDGPVWRAHREAANATMIDSGDVLLLRPARPDAAFTLENERPPRTSSANQERGVIEATILHLEVEADSADVVGFFEEAVAPLVRDGGGSILGYFVSDGSENTFPRLPVREGENVFVWFAGYPEAATVDDIPHASPAVTRAATGAPGLNRPFELLRLAPTSRSLLQAGSPACIPVAPEPKSQEERES